MDILIFLHHTTILITLDQIVMHEDRRKTSPLGLLCQHSVVICAIQGSRFLFCLYFKYSAKKTTEFSTLWCKIITTHLPCEAICCFSVEPGSLALHHFYVAIFLPLWSCRGLSGIWIRRPSSRTSCPTPWEHVSCASSLATGTPAAGWASEWRCTAAPTVSNTHPGVKTTLRKHSVYTSNLWSYTA